MPSIQFPAKWWTRLSLSFVAFLLTDTVKGDQHILTLQCERRSHFCRAAGLTVLGFWLLEASTINSLWASKAFLTILTWQKKKQQNTRSFPKQLTPNQLKQHYCQIQLHVHSAQKRIRLERDSNPWPAILVQPYFIYSFVFTFYGYTTNWPAPIWLDRSVDRALHWYHRGHGFESSLGLNFSSGLISQLLKLWI